MKKEIKVIKTLNKQNQKNIYGLRIETVSNDDHQLSKVKQYNFAKRKIRDEIYIKICININNNIVDIRSWLEMITNE